MDDDGGDFWAHIPKESPLDKFPMKGCLVALGLIVTAAEVAAIMDGFRKREEQRKR